MMIYSNNNAPFSAWDNYSTNELANMAQNMTRLFHSDPVLQRIIKNALNSIASQIETSKKKT